MRTHVVMRSWMCHTCLALLAVAPTACTKPAGPLFPAVHPAIQWPPPPSEPRIRYVGALQSEADLKAPVRGIVRLGNLLAGTKKPNQLYGPRAVTSTNDGQRIWIADPGGRCLHMFDLQNRKYLKIERAQSSPLLSPVGICEGPDDTIFVCDSESIAIHRLSDRDGALVESLRLPEELLRPVALYFDKNADALWVVDAIAHDLKVLDRHGTMKRIVGQRGAKPGQFNYPCDIAATPDMLWIADAGNHRVQAITRDGAFVTSFGQAGDASGDLALPKSVATDPAGNVYVVDARFENVQIFDQQGRLLLFFGEEGTQPGQFWLPGGIHVDSTGRIWICDSYNRRVQVFELVTAANQDAVTN